jgi:hypothetical protein
LERAQVNNNTFFFKIAVLFFALAVAVVYGGVIATPLSAGWVGTPALAATSWSGGLIAAPLAAAPLIW